MPVPIVAIIAGANAAVDLAVKLISAARELPDADSPEAQAEMNALAGRLELTLLEVKAYKPKDVSQGPG
jgi:cobalamin biosynthesis protein CobD/CbiB